jgi:hypothetical protein
VVRLVGGKSVRSKAGEQNRLVALARPEQAKAGWLAQEDCVSSTSAFASEQGLGA